MRENREHNEGGAIFGMIQLGLTVYFLYLAIKFIFFM